jgi:hypothetical protein
VGLGGRDQRAARLRRAVRYGFGFGIVELDGIRLRVVGRLAEPDPSALRYGQPMVLTTEELPSGRVMWTFSPEAMGSTEPSPRS